MMRHFHTSLALVALVGMAIGVPAFAQPSPASYPAACDASKVSKGDVDRAHQVYLSGKQFLDESNYDKAISYFEDAYSIDCSVHAILPIIATAYERKGDKVEAVHALDEYLRRVPTAPDREHIERRIKNLNDQIAHEQPAPSAVPAATTSVAPSASVASEPAPLPSASAAPAQPAAASSGSRSPLPLVLVGVGAATFVSGGVLYIVGAGKVSTAESDCNGGRDCGPNAAAATDGNNGRSLERVGGIAAGVGVAAAGAGLLWYFLSSPSSPSATGSLEHPLVRPVVSPGYAGLALAGVL